MGKVVVAVLAGVVVIVGGVLAYQVYRDKMARDRGAATQPGAMQPLAMRPPGGDQRGAREAGPPPTGGQTQPTEPPAPPAPVLLAQARAARTDKERLEILERLARAHPLRPEATEARDTLLKAYRAANDQYGIRNTLSAMLWKGLPDAREAELKREIATLNEALIFSARASPDGEMYVIKPGDALDRISPKHQVTSAFLQRLNRIRDPKKIRFGDTMKVINGPFDVLVELGKYRLTVFLRGHFVREYRIGIGKDEATPAGTFEVKDKLTNPTWYGPEGEVIAADDPKNPLGERWIGIAGTAGRGYGIHGTIEPESVGTACSRGCIRMIEKDVEEVYDFVIPKLSHVTIVK